MLISMRDFIATGAFGLVRLGMSREQVASLLGPPHVTNQARRAARHPIIWSYGGAGLWFEEWFEERPSALYCIHLNYFPDISYVDTSGIDFSLIDQWILHGDLSLEEAEPRLQAAGLSYSKSKEDVESGVLLLFESGVNLAFSREWSDELLLSSSFARAITR